jgi:Fic-DOC domain mobile mystery protein B
VDDLFDQPDEATPLTPEEQRELNEAEQENIVRGREWALGRRRDPLIERFVTDLHKRMLGDVWRWAGKLRRSERNLGIPFYEIPAALRQLLDEAKAWIEYKSYAPDEIAVRLHHRLVQIHPFPNGNGRHARLMADLLIMRLGGERFSWGSAHLQAAGEVRGRYVAALKAADNHDILHSRAGKVRLLRREELPEDWDPSAVGRLTVWEVTQHLIRSLDQKGEKETANLKSKIGGMAEIARDLAYRLYTLCERKGWAEEAGYYNSLVVAWPSMASEAFELSGS